MDYDCAGCGRPTPAVVGVCVHCRRPNDEREIAAALAAVRERRARPRRLAARAALLAAFVAAVYFGRGVLRKDAAAVRRSTSDLLNPDADSSIPPAPPVPAARPPILTPPPAVPVAPARPAPPAAAPATAASTPAPDVELGANDWALQGRVFDLETLKPVARAKMIFAAPEHGLLYAAELDDFGRFAVALPNLIREGFTIQVNAPGYEPYAQAEPDVPYATLTAAERRALIDDVLRGDLKPSRVVEPDSGRRESVDVYLAPSRP